MDIKLLITKADFDDDCPVPQATTDDKKIEKAIREAQQVELKQAMGAAFYYDLLKNSTEDKYRTLMDGEEYENDEEETIVFPGIRMALKYWAYGRYVTSVQLHVTSASFTKKILQNSELVDDKTIAKFATEQRSIGHSYWEDAIKYLDAKNEDFSLWKSTCKPKSTGGGGFTISAIGGNC